MSDFLQTACGEFGLVVFPLILAIPAYFGIKSWISLSPVDRKASNMASSILNRGWPYDHRRNPIAYRAHMQTLVSAVIAIVLLIGAAWVCCVPAGSSSEHGRYPSRLADSLLWHETTVRWDRPIRVFFPHADWHYAEDYADDPRPLIEEAASLAALDISVVDEEADANLVIGLFLVRRIVKPPPEPVAPLAIQAADRRYVLGMFRDRPTSGAALLTDPDCTGQIDLDDAFNMVSAEIIFTPQWADRGCLRRLFREALGLPPPSVADAHDLPAAYRLRALYSPGMRAGMRREEAEAVLADYLSGSSTSSE